MLNLKTILFALFLLLVLTTQTLQQQPSDNRQSTQGDSQQDVPDVQHFSFLLETIDEYDKDGKGSIRKEDYGDFLYKVITKGSIQQGIEVTELEALKKATKDFSLTKQDKQVGIQNFYEDLVSGFYKFIDGKSEYERLKTELYVNEVEEEEAPLDSLIIQDEAEKNIESQATQAEEL